MSNKSCFDPNSNIQNRIFRVFVSSTFIDMQDERQYLMETVFPRIKRYCLDRDVYFIPIDLRWGITKEQSESGQVVEVCLKSIKQSKPYFIGLLGERYGWKPEKEELKKNPNMKRDFDFLEEDFEKRLSLTEIEMQYGVLREPELMNAAFWIRSKNSVPQASSYNTPLDEQKLEALKAEVRSQSRYPVGEYASIEDMGNQVELFLKDVINRFFPSKTSRLERLMVQQHSFMQQKRRLYVPRQDDYERINAFVDGSSQYFTISGDRGNGKSALISNWMETRSDLDFAYCFVGASEMSDNPIEILKLLIAQLNPDLVKEYGDKSGDSLTFDSYDRSKEERPKNEVEFLWDKFQTAVSAWHNSNPDKKMVLIIDGVNQITKFQNSKELLWLPKLPAFVKAIFTTWKEDVTMNRLKRLGSDSMDVLPLTAVQIKQIITGFLKERNRELTQEQIHRIVEDKESASPVVLRTLLDELCFFGIFEKLDQQIDLYLSADSQEEFFDRVLSRLEKSFGERIVSRLLTALTASRFGLSNEELLGVSNCHNDDNASNIKCTLFNWEQICFSLDSHFVVRSGLNCFSHEIIASAAQKRYQSELTKVRRRIVEYMGCNAPLERKCEEIPWALRQLNDWSGLYNYLLNYNVLLHMSKSFDFRQYWLELYENGYSLDSYFDLDISELPSSEQARFYFDLASFAESIGKFLTGEKAYTKALNVLRQNSDDDENKRQHDFYEATTVQRLGSVYFKLNMFEQAESALMEALAILRRLDKDCPDKYDNDIAATLNNIGLLHIQQGQFIQSETEFSEALALNRRLVNENPDVYSLDIVGLALHNLGRLYLQTARYSEAEAVYRETLDIYNDLNLQFDGRYEEDLAAAEMNLGLICLQTTRFGESERYLKDALAIHRRLVDKNPGFYKQVFARNLLNLGSLHLRMQQLIDAEAEYLEALNVYQELNQEFHNQFDGEIANIQMSLGGVYLYLRRYSESERFLSEAILICQRLVDKEPNVYKPALASALLNQGGLYIYTGRYSEAEAVFLEALDINKELNADNPGVYDSAIAKIQMNLGGLYDGMNRAEEAENSLTEAVTIYRRLVDEHSGAYKSEYAMSLCNLGFLHNQMQRYSEAENLFLEGLAVMKELNVVNPGVYDDKIAKILNSLGFFYTNCGRFPEAERNLKESLTIYRRLAGKNPDAYNKPFSENLINMGILYLHSERYSESEASFLEAVTVLQDKNNAAFVYQTLGDLYAKTNRYSQAEENYNEALKIYRQLAVEEPEEYNHCVLQTLEYLARLHLKQSQSAETEADND